MPEQRTPSAINRSRSWSRLDGVDGLRALAILYVLLNHVNMRLIFTKLHYLRGVPPPLAAALVWQGQPGVQIFFAVSGFLITATSIRRWGDLHALNVRDFYLLRFARIAPLFLALLAVLSLLHALGVHNFVVSPKQGGLRGALLAAFTLRIGWLEATRGYLPGNWDILWSLSVEEMFYLAFPLACRLLPRRLWLVLLLCVFVVLGPFGRTVLTHGNETWAEYSYLGGMDAIAMGCLTAILASGRSFGRTAVRAFTVAGLAILVLCLCFSSALRPLHLDETGLGMSLLAAGACLLILAAAETHWRAPRAVQGLLTYGRRSYEIYLTHMFLVFACFDLFMARVVRQGAAHPRRLIPVLFLLTILLAGLLGELVGRFFSEPANRWLRARFGDDARQLGAASANPAAPPLSADGTTPHPDPA